MIESPALIPLWHFQKQFIANPAQREVICWARGNGKTFACAIKIVLECFWRVSGKPDGKHPGYSGSPIADWLIISASREQAKEALAMCAKVAKTFWAIAKTWDIEEEEINNGREKYTLYRLWIADGIKIQALACSPSSVRGYTANIWWDEACFFNDDREMFAAASNCTRGLGRMIVSSTPFGGRDSKFYEILTTEQLEPGSDRKLWSQQQVDIHEAVVQGRNFDIATEKAVADPDKWSREMELLWIDAAGGWFPGELVQSCEDEQCSELGLGYGAGNRVFLGNDIGLRGDLWVLWALEELLDGRLVTREVTTLHRDKFTEHDRVIAAAFEKYRVIRLAIDQGGIGERSTEHYIDLYGASRVEGVLHNPNNKADMATLSKNWMQSGKVLIPDSPEIRRDFGKVQKSTSANGGVRFSMKRDKHGHGDRASAFMLACSAADGGDQGNWEDVVLESKADPFDVDAGEAVGAMAGWLL